MEECVFKAWVSKHEIMMALYWYFKKGLIII